MVFQVPMIRLLPLALPGICLSLFLASPLALLYLFLLPPASLSLAIPDSSTLVPGFLPPLTSLSSPCRLAPLLWPLALRSLVSPSLFILTPPEIFQSLSVSLFLILHHLTHGLHDVVGRGRRWLTGP